MGSGLVFHVKHNKKGEALKASPVIGTIPAPNCGSS